MSGLFCLPVNRQSSDHTSFRRFREQLSMSTSPISAKDAAWLAHCAAHGIDPQQRLEARNAVLANPTVMECCLYRPDEDDPEAEELDLGDARVLIRGIFQPPVEWDADTLEDYLDGSAPADFFDALLEPIAAPGNRQHFQPCPGDYLAVSQADGRIQMYYLYECLEQDDGLHAVLIREDEVL
jgi:hypothetical protein